MVLITTYFFDWPFRSNCWYFWLRSSFAGPSEAGRLGRPTFRGKICHYNKSSYTILGCQL